MFHALHCGHHWPNGVSPRRKIRQLLSATEEHNLASQQKEIRQRTAKTQARIKDWRKIQQDLMPQIGDKLAAQALKAPAVHAEILFLPSDFPSEVERKELDLLSLAREEAKWREGQAFDHLRALQNVVKTITALRNRKGKNDRKQKENSRAGDNIQDALTIRNQHISSYEVARTALIALDAGSTFAPLTETDLYMKSVQQKRRVGDSRHTDGALWRAHAQVPIEEDADEEMPGMWIRSQSKSSFNQPTNRADFYLPDAEADNNNEPLGIETEDLGNTVSGTQMGKRKSGLPILSVFLRMLKTYQDHVQRRQHHWQSNSPPIQDRRAGSGSWGN